MGPFFLLYRKQYANIVRVHTLERGNMNRSSSSVLVALALGTMSITHTAQVPELAKTAASIAYTTVRNSPERTQQEIMSGAVPSSTHRLWGTAAAALLATVATNKLCATTGIYRACNKATRHILTYPSLPPRARKHVMPALIMVTSSLIYTALFHALHEPACRVEQEVTQTVEKNI